MTGNRKIFWAGMAAGLILFSGCSAGTNTKDFNTLNQVGKAVGIDVSDGALIARQDSHGGFHGDGKSLTIIRFSDDRVEQQIADDGWAVLPPDETVEVLLYGQESEERREGPYFTDEEGNPLIPEVENGYYWLKDRQAEDGIAAGADILHRSSFNFSVAVYDADARILYYGEMSDTPETQKGELPAGETPEIIISNRESAVQEEFPGETLTQETEKEFSFEDLQTVQFRFSSGAGAWSTVLNIREDGSFYGEYLDSNMETGEGNVEESRYQCVFQGQFTEPVKVNDYTWAVQIAQMDYENEPGTEEIIGKVLYRYWDVYGLEDAQRILIYLPGTPLNELTQEFRSWIGYADLSSVPETELPFYALNNEVHQEGFVGIDLRERLSSAEEKAAALEKQLLEDHDLTQGDLNSISWDIYRLWDSLLNEIWQRLKDTKEAGEMKELTGKEREWISWKEQQISEAGAEYEGGTMESMIRAQKGAELTRERVYELMEILTAD